MKLTWGQTDRLSTLDWAQVELNINDTARPMQVEGVVVRAALWGRRFDGFELVVPIEKVSPSGMELMVPNLFARVTNLDDLRGIEDVWGVGGLVEDGAGRVLRIPTSFVEELLERERKKFNPAVRLGDFVRVLWGPERMLCGEVKRLQGKRATVSVEMRSRKLSVTLPVTAVEPLETFDRDYFYKGE